MLSAFRTITSFGTDCCELMDAAASTPIGNCLHWIGLLRYYAHQQSDKAPSGSANRLWLDAEIAPPVWACLRLGSFTHDANIATTGPGHYRILPASLPQAMETQGAGEDGGNS